MVNRIVNSSNSIWELDIKYGYIHKEGKFFFLLNVIDVFDRTLMDHHMGLSCNAKDTTRERIEVSNRDECKNKCT